MFRRAYGSVVGITIGDAIQYTFFSHDLNEQQELSIEKVLSKGLFQYSPAA